MPVTLIVRRDDAIQEFTFDGTVTLGRSSDNQIILDAPNISRHHASLQADGGSPVLTDLGSANGTRMHGEEIEPRVPIYLRPGDSFAIGPYSMEVVPGGAATMVAGNSIVASPTQMATGRRDGRLVITTPRGTHETRLDRDVITIGRETGNDIVVEQDVVSRKHMVLRRIGATFEVEDLGTVNGIRIGREKVTRRLLNDGDVLDVAGVVSLQFLLDPAPEAEPVPEQRLSLTGKAEVTIGRAQSCDVTFTHPAVSLVHARIVSPPGGQPSISDLGSTNGTYVNGERVVPGVAYPLRTGDVIRIGPMKLIFSPAALEHQDESLEIGVNVVHLNQHINDKLNLLKDISFSIRPQEFVAVVGVSGAGKSTLLGALSGLKPASDGQVLLNGAPLYQNYHAFRTVLGYVPQDDILHKELPVQRALEYAAALRLPDDTTEDEQRDRVNTVITTLRLQERKETAIASLSGGQRKRVSIGAELLTQPGLFFLDEATSGLDPGTETQMMKMLRGLADDGHTIILITHATKNVKFCDQVAFLAKGGNLAFYGPPDEALKHFEVTDFDEIYTKLEDTLTPEEWAARYLRSPLYSEYVVRRLESDGIHLAAPAGSASTMAPSRPVPETKSTSALRQFAILTRRYFDIIRRDRVFFTLLFLVAPVLGLIDLGAWGRDVLTPLKGDTAKAMTFLFLSSLFPFLIGALLSVREIVKEAAVYTRERAVSLKIWPYLGSKFAVALLFAMYHALALLVMKALGVEFPGIGTVGYVQLYVTLVLAVVSGVMWALLISALTSKEEQALLLVIGVIVLQVVFSGGMLPLSDLGPVGTVLGSITSTNWAFKGITAAAGVTTSGCSGNFANCDLPGFQGMEEQFRATRFDEYDKSFGDIFDAEVVVCWAAMLAIMVALSVALYWLQKRKDTL